MNLWKQKDIYRISEIKSISELFDIGDNWSNRRDRLEKVGTPKAIKLAKVMDDRLVKIAELARKCDLVAAPHWYYDIMSRPLLDLIKLRKIKLCGERRGKKLPIHDVISNGVPEWLNDETRALARDTWNSHKVTDDGLRVKAVKIIIERAKEKGYEIRLSKAKELLQRHCL